MRAEDVAIIGAGPAGLTTALQLKRYGVNPLVFEGNRVGGLLWNANLVENYPGFPGGISGPELVQLFVKQAESIFVDVIHEEVIELTRQGKFFRVETTGQVYQARIVVVASGTRPKTFAAGRIPEEVRDRVFYEVYPLLHLTGKRVAIIGAGDAAFDYGLNLAKDNDVFILNRGEQVKCLPLLWERTCASPRITYYKKIEIANLARIPDDQIMLECVSSAGVTSIYVDYLIGAIGREPRLDFMSPALRAEAMEQGGELYFVGDVRNGIFRQTAIAVGDGILAAMKIFQCLEEKKQ